MRLNKLLQSGQHLAKFGQLFCNLIRRLLFPKIALLKKMPTIGVALAHARESFARVLVIIKGEFGLGDAYERTAHVQVCADQVEPASLGLALEILDLSMRQFMAAGLESTNAKRIVRHSLHERRDRRFF